MLMFIFLGEHNLFGKIYMWDESHRVPCVMRYPREIPPGSRFKPEFLITHADWAPTLLDYAGAPPIRRTHGKSFRAAARDPSNAPPLRDLVYYRYYADANTVVPLQTMTPSHLGVRTASGAKFILYDGRLCTHDRHLPYEFFDSQADRLESRNLLNETFARDPERVVSMLRALQRAKREARDEMELGRMPILGNWLLPSCEVLDFGSPGFLECIARSFFDSPDSKQRSACGKGARRRGAGLGEPAHYSAERERYVTMLGGG